LRTGPALKLEDCLNLQDIQEAAQQLLRPKAWAYYHSASDDERTRDWNRRSFTQLRLRPRVLRDVTLADLTTDLLGYKANLPVFIAPAAMGRLAHPDGEKCWSRVSHQWNIPYVVSANASVGFEELASETKASDHLLFYQLYVHKDRSKTQETLRRVKKAGYKAIIVTVDAPVAGNRELDIRTKLDAESGVRPEASDTVTMQTKPENDASAASRVSDHSK
jgi:L-lactate dehydrogenase (cytochrome)